MGTLMNITDYMYDITNAMKQFEIDMKTTFTDTEKDVGEWDSIFIEWFSQYFGDK